MRALGPPGAGRSLAFAYAIFALAAGARSGWQISTRFSEAPLPFALSAVAAILYVVLALTVNRPERAGIAMVALAIELAGVLAVGALSLADPGAFADQTVWSDLGSGYLFLPLALPLLGFALLTGRARAGGPALRGGIRRSGREP